MKATKAGYTIGKALESWSCDKDGPCQGTIEAFINLGYFTGELTAEGFLPNDPIASSSSAIRDLTSNIYAYPEASPSLSRVKSREASIFDFVKHNWDNLSKANFDILNALVTKTKTLIVTDTFISPVIYTDSLTANSLDARRLTATSSAFGSLITENATVTGQLDANSLVARHLSVDTIEAGTISAKYIKAEQIEGLEARFGLVSNDLEATLSALLASQGVALQGEALPESAFVDATAGFFREFLAVTGKTSLTDTEISTNLVVGSSLALDYNSISVLGDDSTLYIQPTGQGRISLLADLMTLDNTGQVVVKGNLAVAGQLTIGGVPSATPEVSAFGNLLTIVNSTGQTVASIDASGSATFAKLIIATPEATTSGVFADFAPEVKANASVGLATLPAGLTQVQISNTQVTSQSLIYLTPTSATRNQVLYLKTKAAGQSFTVAIDQPIPTDIEFQYWIIN